MEGKAEVTGVGQRGRSWPGADLFPAKSPSSSSHLMRGSPSHRNLLWKKILVSSTRACPGLDPGMTTIRGRSKWKRRLRRTAVSRIKC